MPLTLRKKAKEHAGRHSDPGAPKGTECVACGRTEPGTNKEPVTLVHCSVCPGWLCSGQCFSLHRAPAGFYMAEEKAPWWKRVVGRG